MARGWTAAIASTSVGDISAGFSSILMKMAMARGWTAAIASTSVGDISHWFFQYKLKYLIVMPAPMHVTKSEIAARYGTQTAPGRFNMLDEPACSPSSAVPDEYGAFLKKNVSTQQMGLRTSIPNNS